MLPASCRLLFSFRQPPQGTHGIQGRPLWQNILVEHHAGVVHGLTEPGVLRRRSGVWKTIKVIDLPPAPVEEEKVAES